LQGLPSGPRTIPGGSGRALEEEDEDCAVEVSVLLELVPIVAPSAAANEEREVRSVRLYTERSPSPRLPSAS